MIIAGLLAPFAVVLVLSGAAKVHRPGSLDPALTAIGIGHVAVAGRVLGAAEIAVGAAALTAGGRWPAAAAAVWFAGLTAVSLVFVVGDAAVPCGCFGDGTAPPTAVHVVTNGAATVVAATAAIVAPPSLRALVTGAPLTAWLLVAQVALGTWLLLAVYRDLTRLADRPAVEEFTMLERR